MSLDKMVYVYSLGTFSFHDDVENGIFRKMSHLKSHKKMLNNFKTGMKIELEVDKDKKKQMKARKKEINAEIRLANEKLNEYKKELYAAFNDHKGIRTLRVDELKEQNVVSLFDSVLTRTMQMTEDEITHDILIIQSYHIKVFEGLIKDGFIHNNEKYIYFTSSAGQIRTKKAVFIKESLWKKHEGALTCGLSLDEINQKGGCNVNKLLAYKALINSASQPFEKFNIDKCIVVDDLDLIVNDDVDYIDRETYEITRKKMDVPLTVTDGVGMILPSVSDKNFMIRLPFVKGLLASYDFTKHGRTVIDIDNNERDVIAEGIEIILTKSQWKMYKYYNSWADYQTRYKENKCEAAMLNVEEDEFNDGKLSYQMLQSLTDISQDELIDIASSTVNDINSIGSDKDVMLRVLGATEANERKRSLQKALLTYPELLNDSHSRETIMKKKRTLVKEAKNGKLNVNGSFTFVIPDLYSFCEYLFNGEAKSLLGKDEVFYRKHEEGKTAILRSPHLSREWGIKNNVTVSAEGLRIDEYFKTDAIYVSNISLLSKLIQNDWDGDKVLCLSEHKDPTLLRVAERNMLNDNIVPLYYEMEKAPAQIIDNSAIYISLIAAFEARIGEISNNITKIWNSDKPDLDVIKQLCMENNFEIDFAKTLFRLKRPDDIDEKIKEYLKAKMPHFFMYNEKKSKKDKKGRITKKMRVEDNNNSTVNRLDGVIPKTKISFEEVAGGSFDYKLLMKNTEVELDEKIIKRYTELDQGKNKLIKENTDTSKKGKLWVYSDIKNKLLEINSNATYITDVLIKYLYCEKDSKFKDTLWESFGYIIERNLEKNLAKVTPCEDCNSRYRVTKKRQVRCEGCQKKRDKENARLRKQKERERKAG